ncbi:MAG: iron export ABC transporter permease subunit FetB [Candidatus Zixiibacteriota bacterium]|jgi:putative ABC transport system permease protein
MEGFIQLTLVDVAIAAAFVVLVAVLSLVNRLGVEKTLAVGAVRTFVQLLAVGYALKWVFGLDRWYLVLLAVVLMVGVAGWHGARRAGPGGRVVVIATAAIFLSSVAVILFLFGAVIRVEPWYDPRYVIPLAGMVINTAMNGASLGMATFATSARDHAERLEAALAAGASSAAAARPYVRDAVKKALIPTLNALMTVGIVQLPGAMTGMILAGSPPTAAVLYQIVIMYMIAAAAALSAIGAVMWYSRSFFTPAHQLRPEQT